MAFSVSTRWICGLSAGFLGVSCLSGCAAGVALAVVGIASMGGGGGGGSSGPTPVWNVAGTIPEGSIVLSPCPDTLPDSTIQELTGLELAYSGETVPLGFEVILQTGGGASSTALVELELLVDGDREELECSLPDRLRPGTYSCDWDASDFATGSPAEVSFTVRVKDRETDDWHAEETLEFLLDNRPEVEVVSSCNFVGSGAEECPDGRSGQIKARFGLRVPSNKVSGIRAGSEVVLFDDGEWELVDPEGISGVDDDPECCGDPDTVCLEVVWDTGDDLPGGSADLVLGVLFKDPGLTVKPAVALAGSCETLHINNSPPRVDNVFVSSDPVSVQDPTRTLVGQVIIDYTVSDTGSESAGLKVSAEFSDRNGKRLVLRTEDGTLTSVLSPGNDGTTGLSTSPGGEPHRFIWNSDYDIDRLVREEQLDKPLLTNVQFSLSAVDEDSCLESSSRSVGALVLDNCLLHSVAGLGPSQPTPVSNTHPRDSIRFGALAALDKGEGGGQLYIVDRLGHDLWRMDFSDDASEVERIAGLSAQRERLPEEFDGRASIATPLDQPVDVSVVESESGDRVYLLERSGNLWELERGEMRLLVTSDVLFGPGALAATVDPSSGATRIYIADTGNCRVLRYELEQGSLDVVLGALQEIEPSFGDYPTTNGCNFLDNLPPEEQATAIVDRPFGVCPYTTGDGADFLFVSDSLSYRLLCVDLDGVGPDPFYEIAVATELSPLCRPEALRVVGDYLYVVAPFASQENQSDGKGVVLRRRIVVDDDGLPRLEPGPLEAYAGVAANAACGDALNAAPTYKDEHECLDKLQVPLSFPSDVLEGPDGKIYICDEYNRRIWRVGDGSSSCELRPECRSPQQFNQDTNRMTTFLGNRLEGVGVDEVALEASCLDPDPPAGEPTLRTPVDQPLGMTFVGDRYLLFSDRGNHRLRRLDLATGLVVTLAGRQRTCPEIGRDTWFTGDGGPAIQALLHRPRAVLVVPPETPCDTLLWVMYYVDHLNHRIRCIDPAGTIRTCAGSGNPARDSELPVDVRVPATQVYLKCPTALAADSLGRVFIADRRHRILVFDPVDQVLYRGVGVGTEIGDPDECAVECPVDPTDPEAIGDGGPALEAQLCRPAEMALDAAEEYLYFGDADTNRIRRVEYDLESGTFGVIETVVGNGSRNRAGDVYGSGDDTVEVAISYPYGLTLSEDDNALYFSETFGGGRVYRLLLDDLRLEHLAGSAGFEPGSVGDGDDPINARFFNPNSVRVDSAGNVYVIDSRNHRIRRFHPGR